MPFALSRVRETTFGLKKIPTSSSAACIASIAGVKQRSSPFAEVIPKTSSGPTRRNNSSLAWQRGIASGSISVSRGQSCPARREILGRRTFATATPMTKEPVVHDVFEPVTGSWQYVVADPATSSAVIIDPVLNFDPARATISTESADALLDIATGMGYQIEMILETHAHADHITAASYIQSMLAKVQGSKPPIGIGSRIKDIQKAFGQRYNIPAKDYEGVFDRLLEDDETFEIGSLTAQAIHLPGHTPDHMGYKIGGKSFLPSCSEAPCADSVSRQRFRW